jgi:hypothetical protein
MLIHKKGLQDSAYSPSQSHKNNNSIFKLMIDTLKSLVEISSTSALR